MSDQFHWTDLLANDVLDLGLEAVAQAQVAAESIGWQPLADDAYLHAGAPDDEEPVIEIVGVADAALAGGNYLLFT